MEVAFASERLRDLVASERALVRAYGKACARRIGQRVQHLKVAETIADLRTMAGRCHQLTGDRSGCLALDLVHPLRLVFEPVIRVPGALDWGLITSVIVIEIVDYH